MRSLLFSTFFFTVALQATEDFSTTNGDKLSHFTEVFHDRTGPVRVLSFGDSMANSYNSVAYHLITRLLEKRPFAGTSFNNSYNQAVWYSTNGATVVPPSSLWFSYQFKVPQGSSVWWAELDSDFVHGVISDQLGLYWIAQPAGGAFDLFISTNGGAWQKSLSLDGYSATPVGRSIKITLPLNAHRLQVASSTGTNYIVGPELVNSTTNGLHVAWLDYGGLRITDVLAVPRAVREPILRAFSPDLLVWHFKEGPDALPGLHAALAENENWFREAASLMDVLYIGTSYDFNGPDYTINANRIVRAFAQEYKRGYLDSMTPGISYEWLRDHNYMDDVVHPNSEGSKFLLQQGWKDLGFFALGADRLVRLATFEGKFYLETTLLPGISYEFQSSPDLLHWSTFATAIAAPGSARIPIDRREAAQHYRMRMLPAQ